MTDDSATLRAMTDAIERDKLVGKASDYSSGFWYSRLLERDEQLAALLASQSSWAKEKAELERQLEITRWIVRCARDWCRQIDEVGTSWDDWDSQYKEMHWTLLPLLDEALARHASRPVTAKE